jgi:DNA-binding NtrC family response regulator
VADGGTLFLDEIGDMPLSLQSKLLRVLEDGAVEPLGANKRVRVDVRIISATNQDLKEAIAAKRFRSDLLFRLNTFEIHLAPLRERGDDVVILAPLLLERFAGAIGKRPVRLSEDALHLLRLYDWPGNVRELRNLMERAAVLSSDGVVTERFFRAMIQVADEVEDETARAAEPAPESDAGLPLSESVDRFERRVILRALDATHDNKAEAARRLGISERNLWYKLKKHGL